MSEPTPKLEQDDYCGRLSSSGRPEFAAFGDLSTVPFWASQRQNASAALKRHPFEEIWQTQAHQATKQAGYYRQPQDANEPKLQSAYYTDPYTGPAWSSFRYEFLNLGYMPYKVPLPTAADGNTREARWVKKEVEHRQQQFIERRTRDVQTDSTCAIAMHNALLLDASVQSLKTRQEVKSLPITLYQPRPKYQEFRISSRSLPTLW